MMQVVPGSIYQLDPPYNTLLPLTEYSPTPGRLVVLTDPRPEEIHEVVPRLRRAHPSYSMVLHLTGRVDDLAMIRASGAHGVRAIIGATEQWPVVLREQLTKPGPMGAIVLDWLNIHRGPVHPQIGAAVAAAMEDHRAETQSCPVLRRRLKEARLPPQRAWKAFSRAVHVGILIQRDRSRRLAQVALDTGYYDQPALNRGLMRFFGATPRRIRDCLGVDWMFSSGVGLPSS